MTDRAAYVIALALLVLAASIWAARPRYQIAAGGAAFVTDTRTGELWALQSDPNNDARFYLRAMSSGPQR